MIAFKTLTHEISPKIILSSFGVSLAHCAPVPEGDTARTIHADHILVELADLDDDTRFVPFGGVRTSLILDAHRVPNDQWWKVAGVFGQAFSSPHVPVAKCFLPGDERVLPGMVGVVLPWVDRDEIPD